MEINAKDKIVLISGATGAIGSATAKAFAKANAKVVLLARNEEKAKKLQSKLIAETGNKQIEVLIANLSDFDSIKNAVSIFEQKYQKLDVLIHSSGLFLNERTVQKNGYETMFATNYLAIVLLTDLLLNSMKKSENGRILAVTSPAFGKIDFDDLQSERKFSPMSVFSKTVICKTMFIKYLGEKLKGSNVIANNFHPGIVKNDLARKLKGFMKIAGKLMQVFATDGTKAAEALVKLAFNDEYANYSGKFFKFTNQINYSSYFNDKNLEEKLWSETNKLLKRKY